MGMLAYFNLGVNKRQTVLVTKEILILYKSTVSKS